MDCKIAISVAGLFCKKGLNKKEPSFQESL